MYVRAVQSTKELREALAPCPDVGFVPTMGALHAGHEKLIEVARGECPIVVVSIFVNPLQFGPKEDYGRYPRTLDRDLEVCKRLGVDFVFTPAVEDVYPMPQLTFVDVPRLTEHLCGKFRPGHFRGVATVVLKLFNMVQPQRAYFGEKDMQQLAVIRRMVTDLNLPIDIVGVPTVRESDGLAMSSRNKYLNEEERRAAPKLYQALQETARVVRTGEQDASAARATGFARLAESPLIRPEYFEIVDREELQPVERIDRPVTIAAAIWIGNTRLIDNVSLPHLVF
jgi:pantoate--beta-alanine ligase